MKHRATRETAGKQQRSRETGEIQTIWTLVVALGFTLLLILQKAPARNSSTSIEPANDRAPSHAMTDGR